MNHFLFRYLLEFQFGNRRKAFDYAEAAYALDSTHDEAIMYMGKANYDAGRYQEAYTYYDGYYNQLEKQGKLDINDMHRMGHTLLMVGKKDSATIYFSKMIEHCNRHIEIKSNYGRHFARYDLAGIYALLGEKDSAYHYLESLTGTKTSISIIVDYLGVLDPMFASIRNEKRFKNLNKQIETEFEAEQERVRQWLEQNDML